MSSFQLIITYVMFMKKILFCFLCIAFSAVFLTEELYATTTFFTSKDGKLFCETDSYDGSFAECDIASQKGNTLTKAAFPYPKLIETPTRQICVVSSIETDMSACQDEIDALKRALGNTTVSRNNANTGTMVSSGALSGTIASPTMTIAKNEVTQLIQKAPAITETSLIELQ